MKKFCLGEPFTDIKDYESYPYTHLYFHGRLIGKAITDNWQFCMISDGVKSGYLRKAKLNDGLFYYMVTIMVYGLNFTYKIIAKNKKDAIDLAIKKSKKDYGVVDNISIPAIDIREISC